ncbi:hypothetical protein [Streptomyces sp. NPDC091416]|uniref:hypothetical protein n=1 Tax=Streptomyces sp. NPDC091416 TaxID=3366003 RepID=UPI0037F8D204
MRGRLAALPTAGYQAPARVLLDDGRCTVRVTSEDGRVSKDFDFTVMPVGRPLQVALAEAFDRRTGPSGTCCRRTRERGSGKIFVAGDHRGATIGGSV